MKGSVTDDTARYSLVESAHRNYAEVKRGVPQSNRGLVPTAFSWRLFDDAKYKLSEFRQWRTNPHSSRGAALARAGLSLREAERISDEVLGGKNSKPAADEHEGRVPTSTSGDDDVVVHAPAAGEETVSDEEADAIADVLVGPVLATPVQQHFCRLQQFDCRCGCGSKVSAYNAALDYALLGLSATNAVENVACHYGLTELEQELMVEQIEEEVADRIRMGRMGDV